MVNKIFQSLQVHLELSWKILVILTRNNHLFPSLTLSSSYCTASNMSSHSSTAFTKMHKNLPFIFLYFAKFYRYWQFPNRMMKFFLLAKEL